MKKINEFVEIKNKDDENATHHEVQINNENTEKLEAHKKTLLEKYFDKINAEEMKKGNESIYKDEKKSHLLIPRNAVELQTLINDLCTLFNS